MTITVTGIDEAQDALNDALREINIESELMLNVILQGISASTMPYVPVDTSFLINSEYRQTDMTTKGPVGELGFGARYARYVHEGPQKNWQKPGASNRFLELGVRDFVRDDLARVIARFQP